MGRTVLGGFEMVRQACCILVARMPFSNGGKETSCRSWGTGLGTWGRLKIHSSDIAVERIQWVREAPEKLKEKKMSKKHGLSV